MSLSAFLFPGQPAATHCRSRTGNDGDWERYRETICQLYATNKLKDVMRIMEARHKFKASEKLYKTKFEEWGADTKRIKTSEYKCILGKRRRREQEGKATKFRVHGEPVPESKIVRWETRMLKQGAITQNESFSEVGTPPSLTFRTPTPSIAGSSPIADVSALHSPLAQSLTPFFPNSPNMRLSPSAIHQRDKLSFGLSVFSGSVDELVSMNASTQQLWTAPTPNIIPTFSPLLNNIQSSPTSEPSSSKLTSPLIRDFGGNGSTVDSLLQSLFSRTNQWNEPVDEISPFLDQLGADSFAETLPIDWALEESLTRLMQLLHSKESISATPLSDLLTLLAYAQRIEPLHVLSPLPEYLQGIVYPRRAPNVSQELSQTRDLLLAAPSVAVNCDLADTESLPSVPHAVIIDQKRKRKHVDTSHGTLIVTTNKRYRRRLVYPHDNVFDLVDTEGTEFISEIRFESKTQPIMLTLSMRQSQTLLGSIPGIPTLHINNVLPKDSLVFQLAAKGRVEDLVSLFAAGKASLRDHDIEGQSLLHYSTGNPPMCRFLVRSGLDVDENSLSHTPLHKAMLDKAVETTDILLEAGADPTLESPQWSPVLQLVAFTGYDSADFRIMRIMRQIYTRSVHFDLSIRGFAGSSLLLIACSTDTPVDPEPDKFNSEQNIQKLSLLLKNGCNIRDIDENGSTCLHQFFGDWVRPLSKQDWKDSLIYLVQQGADPYTLDCLGRSVFDIAYAQTCWDRKAEQIGKSLGTYRGDLLDAVLHACNYNIFEVRQGYSRKRRYGIEYTRQDFELLWEGLDYPYSDWDDALLPYRGESIEGFNGITHQEYICTCWGVCEAGFGNEIYQQSRVEDQGEDSEEDESCNDDNVYSGDAEGFGMTDTQT